MFRTRKYVIGFFEKGKITFKGNEFKTKEDKSGEIKEETKEEFINKDLTFTEEKMKIHK